MLALKCLNSTKLEVDFDQKVKFDLIQQSNLKSEIQKTNKFVWAYLHPRGFFQVGLGN